MTEFKIINDFLRANNKFPKKFVGLGNIDKKNNDHLKIVLVPSQYYGK